LAKSQPDVLINCVLVQIKECSFSASGKEFYFLLKIVVKDTFAKNISIQGL